MPRKHLLASVGATLLFTVGVAAAFADAPPSTVDPTESTTTTTDPSTSTSTSTTTTTETTTTTVPTPTTSTTTTTSPAPTTTTATPPPATSPRSGTTRPRGLPRTGAIAKSPPEKAIEPRRHKKRHRKSKPLKVTPPLGLSQYVFPVVGDAGYIDTYGDFRGDVHGKWHHGDDIFAPLGTPVVAVASGTINRVGWKKAGGWRLWVRDSAANQFYYAHLAGYARSVFHSRYVKAGQVIGFVGNTGDAFPRAPHLHFEIHPHQLLRLRYDGAVDPTTYLDNWTHLASAPASRPLLPRLPKQPLVRREARLVFRQLLATRRTTEQAPTISSFTADAGDRLANRPLRIVAPAAPTGTRHEGMWQLVAAVVLGAVSLVLAAAATVGMTRARDTRRS